MIRINLLPKEERVRSRSISLPKLGSLAPFGALLVVIAIIGVSAILERAKLATLRTDVAEVREEVRALQPQVDRVKMLTSKREELERRLEVINQLDQGRFLSVRLMDHLSRELPKYLWLTNVDQQSTGRISIHGVTFSNLIVADLMMRLERSPMFAEIDLTQTARGTIEDRHVIQFQITANLTPDDSPDDFTAADPLEGWR